MIDAALHIASRGRPVFPVRGKQQPLTPHGLLDATTNQQQIQQWWSKHPDANIGLRTGQPSNVVVLDVDGDDGFDSLRDLERSYQPLPATLSATTPRGGQHYYFQWPGRPVKNSASLIGQALDIRGDGGYVLVPPSVGANGRLYAWDDTAAIAPLPDWLHALIGKTETAPRARTPADTWVQMVRQGLANGQRNTGLTRLVGHLLARDVDARLVLALTELVNTRCRPPLDPDEVHRLVESIAGRELQKRTPAA